MKFEGVQLPNKGVLFAIHDLHHLDVTLKSNLGMILEVILHSLVRLEVVKCGHVQPYEFNERKKKLIR